MHLFRDRPAGRFSPARLFRPDLLVVIGAKTTVGAQVHANILAAGFKGAIVAADAASEIAALAAPPDLAIIAAPDAADLMPALSAKGTFAAVAVSDAEGVDEPQRRAGMRVLGPRSFGIAVPGIGLNATLSHCRCRRAGSALVSQSASLCRSVIDWAQPNGVGFSHIVGIGGRADIGFGLVLDWLARPRHRRDPAGHPATAGPPRVRLRRPRRRRGCARWWRSVRAAVADPDRCGRPCLRGGAAARRRAMRRRPGGPAGRRRNAWPAPVRCAARRSRIVTNAIGPGRLAADAVLGRAAPRRRHRAVGNPPRPSSGILPDRHWRRRDPGDRRRAGGACSDGRDHGGDGASARAARSRVPLLVCAMGETTGAVNRAAWPKPGCRCSPRRSRRCAVSCTWCRTAATVPRRASCRPARCCRRAGP